MKRLLIFICLLSAGSSSVSAASWFELASGAGSGSSVTIYDDAVLCSNLESATSDIGPNFTVGTYNSGTGKIGNGQVAAGSYTLETAASSIPTDSNPFSLSGWFYLTASAATKGIFSIDTAIGTPALLIQQNNTDVRIYFNTAYKQTTAISLNTWYHIVVTFDGTNDWNVYINNGSPSNYTALFTNSASTTKLRVGNGYNGYLTDSSVVDIIAIWNKELTAADVATLYNGGSGVACQ